MTGTKQNVCSDTMIMIDFTVSKIMYGSDIVMCM